MPFLVSDLFVLILLFGGYVYLARRRIRMHAFIEHLGTIAERNLPLSTGLRLIGKDVGGFFRTRIQRLGRLVEEGCTLTEAFDRCRHSFPPIVRNMVALGEQSGNLGAFLGTLRESYRRLSEVQHQYTYLLVYPILLTFTQTVIVFFVCGFIVPNFQKMFQDMGMGEDAERLSTVSGWILVSAQFLFLGTTLVAVATFVGHAPFRFLYAFSSKVKRAMDHAILWIPGVRSLILEDCQRQFALCLGLFLKAGARLTDSVKAASQLNLNEMFRENLSELWRHLEDGGSMAEFCDRSPLFGRDFQWFVRTGEKSGRLEPYLLQAASLYEHRAHYWTHLGKRMVFPAFVLVNGAFIMVFCWFTYSPLVNLIHKSALW